MFRVDAHPAANVHADTFATSQGCTDYDDQAEFSSLAFDAVCAISKFTR